jgi:hypothetical protein
VPYVDDDDPALRSLRPLVDTKAGYVRRASGVWPQRSSRGPWQLRQNYFVDLPTIRFGRIRNSALRFSRVSKPSPPRLATAG